MEFEMYPERSETLWLSYAPNSSGRRQNANIVILHRRTNFNLHSIAGDVMLPADATHSKLPSKRDLRRDKSMSNEIYVDPSAATADSIRVGDLCYVRVGPSSTAPNVFEEDIKARFDDCLSCNESESSSSNSSSTPEIPPCPPDTSLSSYLVHMPAYADTEIRWDAQDVIVNGSGGPYQGFGDGESWEAGFGIWVPCTLEVVLLPQMATACAGGAEAECAWWIEFAHTQDPIFRWAHRLGGGSAEGSYTCAVVGGEPFVPGVVIE
ncbi:MAG: hypothetical protein H7144_08590 [Burkholderiales bacterium]|nr:hypothetical protein [Phycisphaerae bacterium]